MDIFFDRGRIISYLRSSDGSQRALMLKRYETLDDFLSFDGHGSASAAGQVSSKTAELGWLELPAFS